MGAGGRLGRARRRPSEDARLEIRRLGSEDAAALSESSGRPGPRPERGRPGLLQLFSRFTLLRLRRDASTPSARVAPRERARPRLVTPHRPRVLRCPCRGPSSEPCELRGVQGALTRPSAASSDRSRLTSNATSSQVSTRLVSRDFPEELKAVGMKAEAAESGGPRERGGRRLRDACAPTLRTRGRRLPNSLKLDGLA